MCFNWYFIKKFLQNVSLPSYAVPSWTVGMWDPLITSATCKVNLTSYDIWSSVMDYIWLSHWQQHLYLRSRCRLSRWCWWWWYILCFIVCIFSYTCKHTYLIKSLLWCWYYTHVWQHITHQAQKALKINYLRKPFYSYKNCVLPFIAMRSAQ